MAHEIEADFVEDYHNVDRQCHKCTSYGEDGICSECNDFVPPTAHCDYFQSID